MTSVGEIALPVRLPSLGFRSWLRIRAIVWLHRLLSVREVGVLAMVAFAGYVVTGAWMRYGLHFYLNDALNRTADAVYVTVGRDPHLAAIGFFWPPLPQLLQVPLVPLLAPFGVMNMAGPVSTALCTAATIPVMARIGRFLGLGRWTTFTFCLVFAVNHVTIYYAANGMSEACFFFTGSLSLYGFLRYIRNREIGDMWLFSFALAGVVLTRLEGPIFALALGVIATFSWRGLFDRDALRQSAWTALLLGLPSIAAFGLWLAVQQVIEHNAFFFASTTKAGEASHGTPGLPAWSNEPSAAFPWAGVHIVIFGGALVLVALSILWTLNGPRTRGSLGLLAAMGVFAAIQIWSVGFTGTGYGDPRYFVMAVPISCIGAMWVATMWRRPQVRSVWSLGLVALLVANAAAGSWYESSGKLTAIEHECDFFQWGVAEVVPALGRGSNPNDADYCSRFPNSLGAFQEADGHLDSILKPSDRVLIDNGVMFAADLFTRHPNQFVVRNDRDWQKIIANPYGTVTYILTQSIGRKGPPLASGSPYIAGGGSIDAGAQTIDADPAAWQLVDSWSELPPHDVWVQLYRVSDTAQ